MQYVLATKVFWLTLTSIIAILFNNPAIGLLLGIVFAFFFINPLSKFTSDLSKLLLKIAVVLLGFGINFSTVIKVGVSSIFITIVTITFVMLIGLFLGKFFNIEKNISILISSGTAICGGSAIAAIAPTINATSAQVAVSMAVVFLLNSVGLLLFPAIADLINMSQYDFGLWVALAIHDTSSVVGAGAVYGSVALSVATTVKLTRALWIMPLSFAVAKFNKTESGAKFPLFLLGFIIAASIRSLLPAFEPAFNIFEQSGRQMMSGILFLIGTGLTISEIKKIGSRPLIMAVVLWVIISVLTLVAIYLKIFTINI